MIFRLYDHFYFTFVTLVLIRLKKHIETNFSFLKEKKIIVAISGGIDSVVLAHLLQQLKFEISLAHCNFRLRGKASDEDQVFVEALANQLNLPFFTIAFETLDYADKNGVSTQMAARELRYRWFEKIRRENELDYIATAHHLDDDLETFLINFTRGTGLNGLTGIPSLNNKVIRPLLPFSKETIEKYGHENNIEWREDASNSKTAYQRNEFRHKVIPILKKMNPNLLVSFQKTTSYLQESQGIIDDTITKLKKELFVTIRSGVQQIDIEKLKNRKNSKAYLFELLKEYSFTEWNDVTDLMYAQSGKVIYSNTHRLIKDRDHFLLESIGDKDPTAHFQISKGQTTLALENFKLQLTTSDVSIENESKNSIQVDAETLEFPLTLRKWNAGDYFYPFGMKGKKKISKFFKDEKLSLIEKEKAWLLCSKNDIVWIVNRRLDDRFKVTDATQKTIQIAYIED